MLTGERTRLIELYQRATVDTGRYERVERERFLIHLLSKLTENQNVLSSSLPSFDPQAPWKFFSNRRAAYQGREIAATFAFVTEELRTRLGLSSLCEALTRCGCQTGLAIARRLGTPWATASLRLSAIRSVIDGQCSDAELTGTVLTMGECARHDIRIPADARSLEFAIALDNRGSRTAHYPCLEVRAQVQTTQSRALKQTKLGMFSSLLRIEGGRKGWITLRGIDFLQELRSECAENEDLYALRLLITRK